MHCTAGSASDFSGITSFTTRRSTANKYVRGVSDPLPFHQVVSHRNHQAGFITEEMKMKLKAMALAVTAAAAAFATAPASAQISGDVIKIGFITDMSGVYSDIDGQGGAEAIKMAIADMGGHQRQEDRTGLADHQNKADIAASKAREWFDQQGVDMLIGGTNSGTALAMRQGRGRKKKVYSQSAPARPA
jgi:ABC-type branched-subunit amino acid transport system substrate-binding protein